MEVSATALRVMVAAGGSSVGRVIAESFVDAGAAVHVCDVDGACQLIGVCGNVEYER